MRCKRCTYTIEKGMTYCPNCGVNLKEYDEKLREIEKEKQKPVIEFCAVVALIIIILHVLLIAIIRLYYRHQNNENGHKDKIVYIEENRLNAVREAYNFAEFIEEDF